MIVAGIISSQWGCAPVISKSLREQVDRDLTFEEVLNNPAPHIGKVVIWGGDIISVTITKEGSQLKILQKPLDFENGPRPGDRSKGRFLALYDNFLDTAIYKEGRAVTIAGRIAGQRIEPLDEIEYRYPLMVAEEIYLWPVYPKMYRYPRDYWYYDPWYYPYPYYYIYR
jgi:outer membrane lipoprotein